MRIDLRDGIISRLLYLEGTYEGYLLDMVHQLMLTGANCLDIGANIGLYSLELSGAVGPSGRVFAFEPERHNHELLTTNLRLNGATNVEAVKTVVGDRNGQVCLARHPDNFGDHHVVDRESNWAEEVPVETIDAFCAKRVIDNIAFAKIDVQGYEPFVLSGMAETVRKNPDLMVLVEIWPDGLARQGRSASELIASFRDYGFVGYELHDWRVIPVLEPRTYDHIRFGRSVDCLFCRQRDKLEETVFWYLGGTAVSKTP